MKHDEYTDENQVNIAYAMRITMMNPPRAPPAEMEESIVHGLSSPPNNCHVQATRYGNELGLMVYTQGTVPSIIEHAEEVKQTLDLICGGEDVQYSITPMIPMGQENTMTIGERLRELRRDKIAEKREPYGVTKAAADLGFAHSYLSKLEHDKDAPSKGAIKNMADNGK